MRIAGDLEVLNIRAAGTGRIETVNVKSVSVTFPRPFGKPPSVLLTLAGPPPAQNPQVTGVTRNGFTIDFGQKTTTTVYWSAMEEI